ncbi:MAG TPA: metallophosphoesterase, partial [Gaiellaceae bacterium]|nr:metallophosphoesterase [Gaiellaceae bacterium]
MPARVFHISDLHIGRRETSEPFAALAELVREHEPELLLATGDLSHRGRRAELARASELLGELGIPVLAVPGNHDIPYTFPARYTGTFSEWEREFGTTEPAYRSPAFSIVGLNSVRQWRQQGGSLTTGQLRR